MSRGTKLLHSLHAALMPDYNRAAATYWWGLILLGASVIAVATYEASLRPLPTQLQIVAVCVASMLAGGFPVPLPGTKSSFSAAEIFIFLALLYVGLDAACLAAAAEAFVASARTSKRWTSRGSSGAGCSSGNRRRRSRRAIVNWENLRARAAPRSSRGSTRRSISSRRALPTLS